MLKGLKASLKTECRPNLPLSLCCRMCLAPGGTVSTLTVDDDITLFFSTFSRSTVFFFYTCITLLQQTTCIWLT